MQNNHWKTIGDQLPMISPIEFKDNSNGLHQFLIMWLMMFFATGCVCTGGSGFRRHRLWENYSASSISVGKGDRGREGSNMQHHLHTTSSHFGYVCGDTGRNWEGWYTGRERGLSDSLGVKALVTDTTAILHHRRVASPHCMSSTQLSLCANLSS